MARGHGVLVGLKTVDPASYGNWDGANGCWGCELDVDNIERLLLPLGIDVSTLKTSEASADRVLRALKTAADTLRPSDLFVFYYSGHGGQQPDFDGDEDDHHDETLVLYDRELIDDKLNEIWVSFRPGVRIVMLSDSCNSGTNYRMPGRDRRKPKPIAPVPDDVSGDMKAQMIHMGGCRDASTSSGYLGGGAFTMSLCNAWDGGQFSGDYRRLYEQTVAGVHTGQQPQYNEYGPVTGEFRSQQPFTI